MTEHGDLKTFDLSLNEQFHDIAGKVMIRYSKVEPSESGKMIANFA